MLDEIHRQAEGSPIIKMSMDIRERRGLLGETYGEGCKVIPRGVIQPTELPKFDQILVG